MSDSQGTPDFEKSPDPPPAQPPYGQQPPADQPPQYGAPPPPQYGAPPPPQYGAPPPQYGAPQPPQQYGAPGYGTSPYGTPGSLSPEQERLWGGAAHWSALVAAIVGLAFLGPLIVMLTKGNESAFVRRQAVESLNFQLSMLIYGVISAILIIVLVGFLLLLVVGALWLIFTIIGSIKGSNGEEYRYPLTLRMVS